MTEQGGIVLQVMPIFPPLVDSPWEPLGNLSATPWRPLAKRNCHALLLLMLLEDERLG